MTEEQRIKQKTYRAKNKQKVWEARKKYMEDNKDKIYAKKKEWRDANPEKCRLMNKKRDQNKINDAQNKRYKEDPVFRIRKNMGNAINRILKRRGFSERQTSTRITLGCSYSFFKEYLQGQFEPWMNWENHGLYNGTPNHGWDIDHIIPAKAAKTEADIIKLNHYSNLRPLCSFLNRVDRRRKQ